MARDRNRRLSSHQDVTGSDVRISVTAGDVTLSDVNSDTHHPGSRLHHLLQQTAEVSGTDTMENNGRGWPSTAASPLFIYCVCSTEALGPESANANINHEEQSRISTKSLC